MQYTWNRGGLDICNPQEDAEIRPVLGARSFGASSMLGWMALTLSFSLPCALPAGAETITLWDRGEPINGTALAIGTQLFVGVGGAQPGTSYSVEMVDEHGAAIAFTELEYDDIGQVVPTFLWQDLAPCGSATNPSRLHFNTFEEAEAALANRTPSLVLRESKTDQVLVTTPISFDINLIVPRVYAAKADGKPCGVFEPEEVIYVGGYHVQNLARDLYLSVVDAQDQWQVGDPILERRSEYPAGPQALDLEANQGSFLELMWTGMSEDECAWGVVLSPDLGGTLDPADEVGLNPIHNCGGTGRGSGDPECMPCPPAQGP